MQHNLPASLTNEATLSPADVPVSPVLPPTCECPLTPMLVEDATKRSVQDHTGPPVPTPDLNYLHAGLPVATLLKLYAQATAHAKAETPPSLRHHQSWQHPAKPSEPCEDSDKDRLGTLLLVPV